MINQKVLLKNETTYRFGGMCKNFFLLDDKKDLDNFDEAIYKARLWIEQNAPKCD